MTLYEKSKSMSKTEFVNLLLALYNEGYEDGNKIFRHNQYRNIPKLADMDYEKFKGKYE